jgi:tetratricopeptide (TPR) repeat protein
MLKIGIVLSIVILSPACAFGDPISGGPPANVQEAQNSTSPNAATVDALIKTAATKSGSGDFQGALADYDQALTIARQIRLTAITGQLLVDKGNMLLKLKRNDDAIAAYTEAAALDPHPATAYFNLCATQYNLGRTDAAALDACSHAIQADPAKADAYFIQGSMLFSAGKSDSSGKIIIPAGTKEALEKYLQLAPNGPHANDVRAMLDYVGAK